MFSYIKMSVTALLIIYVINILPKSVSTMDLRNLRDVDDWSSGEVNDLPGVSKRQVSGADPWSLCPHTMERVDCFYEYLRVYARLRKAAEYSNSISVRNIGKRLAYTITKKIQDVI